MGHAQNDFLDAQLTTALDDLLKRWNQRFATIKPEPLGSGVFDVDELLKTFCFNQLVEDSLLAFRRE